MGSIPTVVAFFWPLSRAQYSPFASPALTAVKGRAYRSTSSAGGTKGGDERKGSVRPGEDVSLAAHGLVEARSSYTASPLDGERANGRRRRLRR